MSTDFKGNNESITTVDLYLALSDCMSKYLNVDRDSVYAHYIKVGKCSEVPNNSWAYFDRYCKRWNSNDYVGNEFDNLLILKEAINKPEYLDVNLSSVQSRKDSLNSACSSFIQNGLCDNFTVSGYFPHLDCPGAVETIVGDDIPCVLPNGNYATFYAVVKYYDSCGCGVEEPVPYYPTSYDIDPNYSEKLFFKRTDEDAQYNVSAEYSWEIIKNADEVVVSLDTNSMKEPTLRLGTLSTAIEPNIELSFIYTENH